MFVSNQDPVDVLDVQVDRRQPRQRFAFAQPTVHEESRALGLEQCDVARAA
jgi:hypothetical protein